MNNFAIEIPNVRINTYKIVTFIILTLNFLGFGYVFLSVSGNAGLLALAALVLNAVPWLYYLLNKNHIKTPVIECTLIASAFLWIYFGNFWMGAMLLFFGLMSFFTNKKPLILFNDDGIIYPSFPEKKYAWAEVEQVIWKDDILTIDLKDNKLLQFTIDKNIAAKLDVAAFNLFCEHKCER